MGFCRGLVFGVGIVCGPIVGGAFANSNATWRWGFYLNLVVGGLFAPVYIFLLPDFDPTFGQKAIWARFREIDYLGSLLSIGTLTSIIMAINFGGTLFAWNSGQVIALFAVAALLSAAFALQQAFCFLTTQSGRLFPVQFLALKEATLLFILSSAANAGGYIPLYYIPLFFQFTRGDDALKAAVRLLPFVFLYSFTVISNGALMSRFGLYQPWYIAGSVLLLIGGALSCKQLMSSILHCADTTANAFDQQLLREALLQPICTASTSFSALALAVRHRRVSQSCKRSSIR